MGAIQEITRGAYKPRVKVSEDILKHLYFTEKLSLRQIGEKLDRHMSTVLDYFVRYGIKRRSISEGRLLLPLRLSPDAINEVLQLYALGDGTTTIAKKLYTTEGCVRSCLVRNNIKMRNLSEAGKLAYERGNQIRNMLGKKGVLCPCYKGGFIRGDGYKTLLIPEHHRANKQGYVMEHIFIWEQVNNRKLPQGWVIHHLNGIRNDNRPENLIAMKRSEHLHQSEPFKKRIRALESKIQLLEKALQARQLIYKLEEN